MKLVKEHTKDIYDVECPILIILGDKDFVVPIEKVNKIYEKIENKNKKIIVIENGIHWFLSSETIYTVLDDIKEFIRS